MEHLTGKIVAVGGSGGIGVGGSLARLASGAGAYVVGCDLGSPSGYEKLFVRGDLSLEDDAKRFIETAVGEFGRVDILINNACRARRDDRDPHDTSAEIVMEAVRGNALPAINCARMVLPHMVAKQYGVIEHVSSVSAGAAGYGQIGYSMAKAMLARHAAGVAATYGRFGVRCVVPMLGTIPNDGPSWKRRDREMPGLRTAVKAFTPSGKLLSPDDAAAAILELASDALWPLNGSIVPLDGGVLAAVVPFRGGDWWEQACRIAEFGLSLEDEHEALVFDTDPALVGIKT